MQYTICRYDDGAVFNYSFNKTEVSRLDYFHPSLAGQATLAKLTWTKTPWAAANAV